MGRLYTAGRQRAERFVEDRLVQDLTDDLTLDELAGLRQVLLRGRSPGQWLARELLARNLVIDDNGCLRLTLEGRRALVRGSPASWSLVA